MIGLISDTHGRLDPCVHRLFAGAERILHAGDVCGDLIIPELETIAPVTVVAGNCDHDPLLRPTELVTVGGLKFLLHHIVHFGDRRSEIFAAVRRAEPDIVVFGHTHQPCDVTDGGVRYLNPGSVSEGRRGSPRSVATLDTSAAPAIFRLHELR